LDTKIFWPKNKAHIVSSWGNALFGWCL